MNPSELAGDYTEWRYTRDKVLEHLEQVSTARQWPADQYAAVLEHLTDLPGWAGAFGIGWDFDGKPDEDWYAAAAAYLRTLDLVGASTLADLYDQRVAMDEAQFERDLSNNPVVQEVTHRFQTGADVVGAVDTVVNTGADVVDAAVKRPRWFGLGLGLAAGLGLFFALRR